MMFHKFLYLLRPPTDNNHDGPVFPTRQTPLQDMALTPQTIHTHNAIIDNHSNDGPAIHKGFSKLPRTTCLLPTSRTILPSRVVPSGCCNRNWTTCFPNNDKSQTNKAPNINCAKMKSIVSDNNARRPESMPARTSFSKTIPCLAWGRRIATITA